MAPQLCKRCDCVGSPRRLRLPNSNAIASQRLVSFKQEVTMQQEMFRQAVTMMQKQQVIRCRYQRRTGVWCHSNTCS